MTSAVPKGVFISYSRVNGDVVTIAAKLLRAGGATVFQDVVDIEYGSDWQEALAKAIRQCERVLVFWSLAASTSEWVEREWRMALRAGKRIVPMLLDKTPLPAELSRFNGMPELMQLLMLVKQPQAAASPRPSALPPSRPAPLRQRRPSFLLPAIGVAFGAVFCGVLFFALWPQADRPPDVVAIGPTPASGAVPAGPASAPASAAADAVGAPAAGWSLAIVVALLLLLGVAAWFLLRRRKSKSRPATDTVRADEDAEAFSLELETPRRPSWQNTDIPDLDRPAAADTQARLVREIGPLFTRQLFD